MQVLLDPYLHFTMSQNTTKTPKKKNVKCKTKYVVSLKLRNIYVWGMCNFRFQQRNCANMLCASAAHMEGRVLL